LTIFLAEQAQDRLSAGIFSGSLRTNIPCRGGPTRRFHIVWNGVEALCFVHHLIGGYEDELRVLVDEFLMSHGQATRSTFTYSRVIHFMTLLPV
jgi:hypothetical protein